MRRSDSTKSLAPSTASSEYQHYEPLPVIPVRTHGGSGSGSIGSSSSRGGAGVGVPAPTFQWQQRYHHYPRQRQRQSQSSQQQFLELLDLKTPPASYQQGKQRRDTGASGDNDNSRNRTSTGEGRGRDQPGGGASIPIPVPDLGSMSWPLPLTPIDDLLQGHALAARSSPSRRKLLSTRRVLFAPITPANSRVSSKQISPASRAAISPPAPTTPASVWSSESSSDDDNGDGDGNDRRSSRGRRQRRRRRRSRRRKRVKSAAGLGIIAGDADAEAEGERDRDVEAAEEDSTGRRRRHRSRQQRQDGSRAGQSVWQRARRFIDELSRRVQNHTPKSSSGADAETSGSGSRSTLGISSGKDGDKGTMIRKSTSQVRGTAGITHAMLTSPSFS